MIDTNRLNICCIGAGYVGGPTMAVVADKCPFHQIEVVDINKKKIDAWNDNNMNNLPVFEPGLSNLIEKTRNRNLFFHTDTEKAISSADIIFISVNTPIKKTGLGAGKASDLRWIESCARQIGLYAKGHTIVVEKSTLPVKTASTIKSILGSFVEGKTFSVLSNPEFLAEGTAINDLLYPDRVLIGGEDEASINILKAIYINWVEEDKIITTNLWSSELSKLTANAFLAQRISSINSISSICEATGANIHEVAKAVGSDHRIGSEFLNPGPGFGGSCFKKDILNLTYLCNHFGLNEVATYWEQVIKINCWQQERIYKKIVEKLFGNLVNKKIAILGFAFKANTNDTRESPAISISKHLLSEGAKININDPKVKENSIIDSFDSKDSLKNLKFINNVYECTLNTDAVIILTEWDEYKKIDWQKIASKMRKPSWVFDTRGITNKKALEKFDLNVWKLGQG